jgi:alkylation response protein AidB-like acyl-CoA dehydrogenase
MDFHWSEQHLCFRKQLREAIRSLLPDDWEKLSEGGPGSTAQLQFSREFCPKVAELGLLVPHWPREYGGRGLGPWEQVILAEEMSEAGEPRALQYMNVNFIGPTIMQYGSAEQKAFHLKLIRAGRTIWCQGFSEPNAGSDLAALRTRAVETDRGYVINGSKIWTSAAHCADYCMLLARTGEGKNNIAVFLAPMNTPGIEVRDIAAMVGGGAFHEVFFTGVELPATTRLGGPNQGWEIVRYALQHERIGVPHYAKSGAVIRKIVRKLKAEGRLSCPLVRARIGRVMAACEAARVLTYRVVTQRAHGMPPTVDVNLTRIATVKAQRLVVDFLAELASDTLASGGSEVEALYRYAIAIPLASGPTEVQLDLVARHMLGLPRS